MPALNNHRAVHSTVLSLFLLAMIGVSSATTAMAEDKETPDLVDYSAIPRLEWTGPGEPGTYAEYMAGRPDGPLVVELLARARSRGQPSKATSGRVLVLINSSLQPAIQSGLDTYVSDIEDRGYTVDAYTCTAGTAEELKSFIQSSPPDLVGCVLVGDIPTAWFEYSGDSFPCDLFLMDLDGEWGDNDQNGLYDEHENGSGDEAPDIFVGRIDASRVTYESETNLMIDYFDKLHDYYCGYIDHGNSALTYTEDDWAMYPDMLHDISYAYPNYEVIRAPNTNRDDYRDAQLSNKGPDFIQLACHSYSGGHQFTRGGMLYSNTIWSIPPQALFYNLFCCSACLFTDDNCLGAVYVFNSSLSALTVIGSTKSGSMLVFYEFYQPLGQGKTFGQSFKEWFEVLAPYSHDEIIWHYGMSIIGDPMVTPCAPPPRVPRPDIKINDEDGPLYLPSGSTITVTISLDPGDQTGLSKDWWVFAVRNGSMSYWWQPPRIWTPSLVPIRSHDGALLDVSNQIVGKGRVPRGSWDFHFAIDELNGTLEETYIDTASVQID